MATNKGETWSNNSETDYLPPLYPARDVPAGEYPRARFDEGLGFAIKEEARRRAPDESSKWNHKLGFAAELAVSGLLQTPVNREIYPDYEGDDGFDLVYESHGDRYRVEVKCSSKGGVELNVNSDKIDSADYFVLCRTLSPRREVEIIGYISCNQLKALGHSFPDSNEVKIPQRLLQPFPPIFVSPDRIRDSQVQL